MIKKLPSRVIKNDFIFFTEGFENKNQLNITSFHPFQCPIAITEAKINEHVIQDYGVFSLLILRLFDIGIKSPEEISAVSGMSIETVNTYINKEIYGLQHIDPDTGELTELGSETVKENQNGGDEIKSHEIYETVRRFHIDAVTGTVVPAFLQREFSSDITPNSDAGDFILPREEAENDAEFKKELNKRLLEELNSRLDEYVDSDYISDGNIIDKITSLSSLRVFYRWAYLVMLDGMKYPMIVMSGRKKVDNVNAKSNAQGNFNKDLIVPLAISQTDVSYLKENGIEFENVIVRQDSCFHYLASRIKDFNLSVPETPQNDGGDIGNDNDIIPDDRDSATESEAEE